MLRNLIAALLWLPVNRRHAMVGDASGAGEGRGHQMIDESLEREGPTQIID